MPFLSLEMQQLRSCRANMIQMDDHTSAFSSIKQHVSITLTVTGSGRVSAIFTVCSVFVDGYSSKKIVFYCLDPLGSLCVFVYFFGHEIRFGVIHA